MNAREEELTARALLADPAQVDVYLQQKRWAELAALVRFARRDVPVQLARKPTPPFTGSYANKSRVSFCAAAMSFP